MRKKKYILFALLLSVGISTLGGCSPKTKTGNATIDAMSVTELGDALVRALGDRSTYKTQVEELQVQVDDLNQRVQGIQIADPEFPAITKVEDGTDRVTFKKPSDYIKLPDPLSVPGSIATEVNNKISMGGQQGLTLNMAPIWSYRIEGNKLWMSSSTGVYGVVVLGKLEGALDLGMIDTLFDGSEGQVEEKDAWDRIITPYIAKSRGLKKSIPADPGKGAGVDEQITWNKNLVGRQVILNTTVENKSAVVRVGAFSAQGTSVVYTFVYDTEEDAAKEAIILSAVQGLTVQNVAIAVAH